jgi:hypothetical protein
LKLQKNSQQQQQQQQQQQKQQQQQDPSVNERTIRLNKNNKIVSQTNNHKEEETY